MLAALLFAQAAAAPALPPLSAAAAQLETCMDKARADPANAIAEASNWAASVSTEDASYPQQCLGMAYTYMLRWDAAERAFLVAREAAPAAARVRRAQLAAMAGNAALADNRGAAALAALELARMDAEAAGDPALQAIVEVDRARALVLQGEAAGAEAALASARTLDAQNAFAWLLSATLSRRLDKLDEAQAQIATAATLAPDYPEIGLEAGVIAVLRGDEDAARRSWQSVLDLEPDGETATIARGYLAQLAEPAPAP